MNLTLLCLGYLLFSTIFWLCEQSITLQAWFGAMVCHTSQKGLFITLTLQQQQHVSNSMVRKGILYIREGNDLFVIHAYVKLGTGGQKQNTSVLIKWYYILHCNISNNICWRKQTLLKSHIYTLFTNKTHCFITYLCLRTEHCFATMDIYMSS